jgi:septal ring factor EnvC (AmiA/AmiB activator)
MPGEVSASVGKPEDAPPSGEAAAAPAKENMASAAPPSAVAPSSPSAATEGTASGGRALRSFAAAKGAVLLPVSGRILHRFGEAGTGGIVAKGIEIETRPGAAVVAPYDGRVEFAGPFRGYDQILIIEHGDGYHSLLIGLGRIDAVAGQELTTGEPVGVTKSGGGPTGLYLEFRYHGQPIDPRPWLAVQTGKASG